MYIADIFRAKSPFLYLNNNILFINLFLSYIQPTNEICSSIQKSNFEYGANLRKNSEKLEKFAVSLYFHNIGKKFFLL